MQGLFFDRDRCLFTKHSLFFFPLHTFSQTDNFQSSWKLNGTNEMLVEGDICHFQIWLKISLEILCAFSLTSSSGWVQQMTLRSYGVMESLNRRILHSWMTKWNKVHPPLAFLSPTSIRLTCVTDQLYCLVWVTAAVNCSS